MHLSYHSVLHNDFAIVSCAATSAPAEQCADSTAAQATETDSSESVSNTNSAAESEGTVADSKATNAAETKSTAVPPEQTFEDWALPDEEWEEIAAEFNAAGLY